MTIITKITIIFFSLLLGQLSKAVHITNDTCNTYILAGSNLDFVSADKEVIILKDKGYHIIEKDEVDVIEGITESELILRVHVDTKINTGIKRNKCKVKLEIQEVSSKVRLDEPRIIRRYPFSAFSKNNDVNYDLVMTDIITTSSTERHYKSVSCKKALSKAISKLPQCQMA